MIPATTGRDPHLGARIHMALANAGGEPLSTMQVTELVGLHGGFACGQVWRELDRLARGGHAERVGRREAQQCRYWRATPAKDTP